MGKEKADKNIKALARILDYSNFSIRRVNGVNVIDLHVDNWDIKSLNDIILDNNIEDVLIMGYATPGRDYGGYIAYFNGQEIETAESYVKHIQKTNKAYYDRELETLGSQGGSISALPNVFMDSDSYEDDLTEFLISKLNCSTVIRIPNLYSE